MTISPKDGTPKISLIFVNFRSGRYLERALRTLFHSEPAFSFEIVVVNNDPSETPLLAYLKRTYPFTLLESVSNEGFARAVNRGAAEAKAPLLGLLNPDILWPARQLETITQFFENHPRSILGLSLRDERGKAERFGSGPREVSLLRLILNHLFGSLRQKRVEYSPAAWVSGGALFVPRDLFQELGGLDPAYFLYYEDVDFSQRARREGVRVWAHHRLWVTHLRGKSQPSLKVQKNHYRASRKQYFAKFRPAWEQRILTLFSDSFR